ncbi:MAG: endonuclease III [bacterium]|nr:endonuclease III [bacterium]
MHKFRSYTKSWIRRESQAKKRVRASKILSLLKKKYPKANMMLNYSTHFQLLMAVILSAQCTDKKVNEVTIPIFKKYKKASDFAKLSGSQLEKMVRQTGFYRNKAKNIIAAAKKIDKEFGGELPHTMDEILTIPGVARKTANVVLGNAYGVVEGIAVDTHVARINQRWGFATTDNPVKIERELMKLIPKKDWFKSTYLTIEHGRETCTAQRRKCNECPLKSLCPSSLVQIKKPLH